MRALMSSAVLVIQTPSYQTMWTLWDGLSGFHAKYLWKLRTSHSSIGPASSSAPHTYCPEDITTFYNFSLWALWLGASFTRNSIQPFSFAFPGVSLGHFSPQPTEISSSCQGTSLKHFPSLHDTWLQTSSVGDLTKGWGIPWLQIPSAILFTPSP